ncbi:MAG TPA: 8-amino-7-oxononanoate synthase [Gemmataceae bacterium]|nr:8-amino-7-oxononanoate synthase [Gemmataceae bacterium]
MSSWMDDELNDLRRSGLYRRRRRLQSAQGAVVWMGNRQFTSFSSNDYLNLAADPRLTRAARAATHRYGSGAGASPLISGLLPPLRALERALAHWEGTESALVFSSGFAANLAVVSSLAGANDTIFSDQLNHASLIDGCRLSRARVHVYRHGDAGHLEELLRREGQNSRRRVIVTDSVFSMDGDFAPLQYLYELARRFDAVLVLDEAHATGVLGKNGRGLVELFPPPGDLDPDSVIRGGTLSKALGAQGGFVCGSRRMIAWLVNRARPYIFSTALAPPLAAAARRAIALVQALPERRRRLLALASRLRERLQVIGHDCSRSRCQIVPIDVGDARGAVRISRHLAEAGLLVPAVRPPSVPDGTSRLRVSLTAGHNEAALDQLVDTLRQVWP